MKKVATFEVSILEDNDGDPNLQTQLKIGGVNKLTIVTLYFQVKHLLRQFEEAIDEAELHADQRSRLN